MSRRPITDYPWFPPAGREALNEQAKLRAGLLNAAAIAFFVAGFAGPLINPQSAATLTGEVRIGLMFLAWALHSLARFAVRGIEDKQ